MKPKKITGNKAVVAVSLVIFSHAILAQGSDSVISKPYQFTINITATTKGISTFPNLTVGKPAAIFEVVAGRRLTFEPQLRFTEAV